MKISEHEMLKIVTTLILDFYNWANRMNLNDDQISVGDVQNYCRLWIKENLYGKLQEEEKEYVE